MITSALLLLEHINLNVVNRGVAEAFYVNGLGYALVPCTSFLKEQFLFLHSVFRAPATTASSAHTPSPSSIHLSLAFPSLLLLLIHPHGLLFFIPFLQPNHPNTTNILSWATLCRHQPLSTASHTTVAHHKSSSSLLSSRCVPHPDRAGQSLHSNAGPLCQFHTSCEDDEVYIKKEGAQVPAPYIIHHTSYIIHPRSCILHPTSPTRRPQP
jgi:hypothetical protein